MATVKIVNEGRCAGVWVGSRTNASVSVQADATSATLMLYADERGTGKELPLVLGVSHSIDKDERAGYLQIPTMTGERKVRYYTFGEIIRALDAAGQIEDLIQKVARLEAAMKTQQDSHP